MDAVYSSEEIIEITSGRLAAGMMGDEVGSICDDTRQLMQDRWFIALGGRSYDGHDFLGDAFAGGALGCIVEERPSYAIASNSFPLIAVDDTLLAYHRLARNWRRRIGPEVIVCCGEEASARLLMDELTRILLGQQLETVPFIDASSEAKALAAILAMPATTAYLPCVFSPRSFEAVTRLAQTLEPTVLVVMKGALDHFRLSESHADIAQAKLAMFDAMNRNKSTAIVVDLFPDALYASAQGTSQSIKIYPGESAAAVGQSFTADPALVDLAFVDLAPEESFLSTEERWCLEQTIVCLELDKN